MAKPPPLERVTVAAAVARYITALERKVARSDLSPATFTAYRRDLVEFVDLVDGDTTLDDLEADDIEAALTVLAKAPDRRYTKGAKISTAGTPTDGRGPHARARWFAAVRGLFRWSAERGYVQVDPTLQLTPPRTPKRAKGARLGLQADEARALRAAPSAPRPDGTAPNVRLSLRDEALLRLLTESGPRVSEVCGANVEDIRLHEETRSPVLSVLGKGNKVRDLPLSPSTYAAIGRYLATARPAPGIADPNDPAAAARARDASRALFVSVRGWRLNPRDIERLIERHAKAVLSRRATPHSLRHTALTILARGGTDIATVAQIAGHANLATTSIYMDESMSAAAAAIDSSSLAED